MKTAIIFGGSKGIGAQIAKEFAKGGYFVAINYNSSKSSAEQVLDDIKDMGGQGIVLKADITKYDEVQSMIDELLKLRKTIDVAIVSSGISKNNLLIDAPLDEINEIINTNLIGTIYACKAVA